MTRQAGFVLQRRAASLWLAIAAALLAPLALGAADGATLTYRRVFKGSTPEFIEVKVAENGAGSYDIRQLSEDSAPQSFTVSAAVCAKLFSLASDLHDFAGADLDVHRRIADLGQKTLRYEKGSEVHETQYNYTINHAASQLQMIFEGLSKQQEDLADLDQKLRYDRLGVNDALLQLEGDIAQHTIPEPDRFLPVLDRIAADSRLVDVARQRARSLAERIRSVQPQP
jgi:hypothetical protein